MRYFRFFLIVLLSSALFACSAQTPGVSGRWIGVLDTIHADGSVQPDDAYFVLAQQNGEVTGTAGNSPTQLSPIAAGKFAGAALAFDVVVNPQITVHFQLLQQGDRLTGTAAGLPVEAGSTVQVEVSRADAAWKPSLVIEHTPDRLFSTVAALDTRLFTAYNQCDLATLGSMVTDDLEFYHDKTGLSVGKQVFIDSIRNNICGKPSARSSRAPWRSTASRATALSRSAATVSPIPGMRSWA
jgi:hypothetical protein